MATEQTAAPAAQPDQLSPTPTNLGSAVLLPVLSFVVLLLAWQLLVVAFKVPDYILPAPSQFLARVIGDSQLLWLHGLWTGSEVLMGFAVATVVSIPLALLIASVRLIERALYPLIVFFQLIPKIAIAPLFIVWFGFGPAPKVLLTFLLCFFPLLVDSMTGFKSIEPRLFYLTKSMGATRWQTFRYVRLPAALPFIFSGLKVSAVFAITAAIVGEFVGANAGLGYVLLRASSYLDTSLMFAVLVVLSLMGLALSYAVEGAEHVIMPWRSQEKP